MTVRNLSYLFKPRSVALIGATDRPHSVGAVVMRNLLQGGFSGPIMPVNPTRQSVSGVLAYPNVKQLPVVPDLAVICTPPPTVPDLIRELSDRGTRAAIVVTAGLSRTPHAGDTNVEQAMLLAARPRLFRILGPNGLGILVPGIGLNASFAPQPALPGNIAFVSQSGTLCTLVLDWARPRGIGFSHFISLGDASDISFADVIDYLGSDPDTKSILLYMESIKERRSFMSAARAAARNKPVMVVKSGREAEGALAAASHTGALVGADNVYDSAFRRAGMLRVNDINELFAAVETLARCSSTRQAARLAIITNGGGIGVMAVDALIAGGGRLAKLSAKTIAALDQVLPSIWSGENPVDIIGDAPGTRYVAALNVLLDAPEVDVVLCMHAPVAISSPTAIAAKVIDLVQQHPCSLLTCWAGEESVAPARKMFNEAGVPTYTTPGQAVQAFLHIIHHRRSQEILMQTPPSAPTRFAPVTNKARNIIEQALGEQREILTEPDAKAVLSAYGIPTVETLIARTPLEAGQQAARMGGRVALKILSPDVLHKTDVGGVMLDLYGCEEVEKAAASMLERVAKLESEARIEGFTVQHMTHRPAAQELIIGATTDAIFGPVILFGQGGTAVEVIGDRAVALPPLNMSLARDLISRTRIFNLLMGFRDRPPANIDSICLTLMQISQLIIDLPEIVELDINPLFADADGVLAMDARIKVAQAKSPGAERLAIRPYPQQLESSTRLPNGKAVLLRPIRPEDEPEHREFISNLSNDDKRFRFFSQVRELPHSELARLTQIDYAREMAFIATAQSEDGRAETLGVVRAITDPLNEQAEFAVVVRSDLKGQGLGRKLTEKIIDYCRSRGTKVMLASVLNYNRRMLTFAQQLGFEREHSNEPGVVELKLVL